VPVFVVLLCLISVHSRMSLLIVCQTAHTHTHTTRSPPHTHTHTHIQGWEETTDAAMLHLLRTSLSKSARNVAIIPPPIKPLDDIRKLSRYVCVCVLLIIIIIIIIYYYYYHCYCHYYYYFFFLFVFSCLLWYWFVSFPHILFTHCSHTQNNSRIYVHTHTHSHTRTQSHTHTHTHTNSHITIVCKRLSEGKRLYRPKKKK